jgi:uncharacterized protein YfaS (alpha-2-macroglobulin family)
MKNLFLLLSLLLITPRLSAQDWFAKKWNEVEQLETKSQIQDASKLVDRISKRAVRKDNQAQLIKAFLFRAKFSLINKEEAREKILSDLETAITNSPLPEARIYHSLYAQFLLEYYSANRWEINKRSTGAKVEGLKTWDKQNFQDQILYHINKSLENMDQTGQIPVDRYAVILDNEPATRRFRPSLFDLLVHRAIDLLGSDSYLFDNSTESEMPIDHFYQLEIEERALDLMDSISAAYKVDKLYRQLEIHASSKNRREVMYYNRLKRLEHTYAKISSQKVSTQYENALRQFCSQIIEQPFAAIVNHNLAAYYYNLSNLKITDKKDYRIKAKELAEETVKKIPNTVGAIRCQNLLDQINHKSLSIVLENNVIPEKPVYAKITYRNVENVKAFVFPYQQDSTHLKVDRDSLYHALLVKAQQEGITLQLKNISLPESEDTYEHSALTSLRGVAAGKYLVVFKAEEDEKSIVDGVIFNSTHITLLEKEENNKTVLQVLDREYGSPLSDAVVHVKRDSSVWKAHNPDKNGVVSLSTKKREKVDLMISHKLDTLKTEIYPSHYNYSNNHEDNEVKVSSAIYLDRAIYRPGQTVYFKAVTAVKSEGKIRVLPNEEFAVLVENSNGDEIYGTVLKTNEFGSLHGSFTFPQNGPTGHFTINIESPEETEFWDSVDDHEQNEKEFRVEEYKRPTFKVDFEEIEETFKPNDSVEVYAFAKALLGQPLTDADVKVHIRRDMDYHSFDDGEYLRSEKEIIASYDTITDASGRIPIKFLAKPDQKLFARGKHPNYRYTIEVEVTDVNGETHNSEKRIRIGRDFLQLKLICPNFLDDRNHKIGVSLEDLNGIPLTGHVQLEVYRLPDAQFKFHHESMLFVEFVSNSKNESRKTDPEDRTEWKLVHRDSSRVIGSKDFQLPIEQSWKNGEYLIIASAGMKEIVDSLESKKRITVWTDKNLPGNSGIVDHRVSVDDSKVSLDLFTVLDSVTVNVVAYDKFKQVDQKYVVINRGKTTISYDLDQFEGRNINFDLSTQRNNYFIETRDGAVKPVRIEKPRYELITKTFRDRLRPGEEETWSFEIKSEQKSHPELEFLASMYDTSLDQFVTSTWDDIYFYESYRSFSPRSFSELTPLRVGYGNLSFDSPFYRNLFNSYDDLNLYGVNFGRFESSYKRYLSQQIRRLKDQKPVGGQVVGQITDPSSEPVFGATIQIEGSDVFATSDFDGNYSIPVSGKQTLIFSYTGYDSQRKDAKEGAIVNVMLSTSLDEVVVTGYRTTDKTEHDFALGLESNDDMELMPAPPVVMADSTVSSFTVYDRPNASFIQTLQGQVPGVKIQTVSGQPGSNSLIQLRGVASINSNTEPLIVVDGIPITEAEFRNIDPYSIRETAVLKDAAGTAIYGNRGANVVIIISTKKGVSVEDLINQELMASNVQVRRDLDETAFFLPALRTDKDGKLSFNFTSPELLTQWKFRLLGHDKQANTAKLEKTVVTQKELSIVPNAPRFLREGDSITLSTKITNLTKEKMNGFARLELFDATSMQPLDDEMGNAQSRRSFEASAKGNTSVEWKIYVPKDIPAITYRIIAASSKFSDGEENVLPVLSNRELVTVSKNIWVREGQEETVVMDQLASNTSTTLSNKSLKLEYTTNPAWTAVQSLPYLMEYQHECSEQLFSRYMANAISSHIMSSNPELKELFAQLSANGELQGELMKNESLKSIMISHTPWALEAKSQEENLKKLAQLFDQERTTAEQKKIIEKLAMRQQSDGGFPWFNGGRTSDYITRHILAGIGRLQQMGVGVDNRFLENISENALSYLDKYWEMQFDKVLEDGKSLDNYFFGYDYWHYQYARSFFTSSKEVEVLENAYEFAFAKAKNDLATLPLYQRILISIAMHRKGDKNAAKNILDGLKQSVVRDDEKGAYWKNKFNGYQWYASDIETHATAIEAFSEMGNDEDFVSDLKAWLLQNKRANSWKSTKATALAVHALLYGGTNWIEAEPNSEITWAGKEIKQKELDQISSIIGEIELQLSPEEITPEHSKVTIKNKGEAPGYGAMYWQYLEQLDKIVSDNKGELSVTKELYTKETSQAGERLVEIAANSPIEIGDRIVVRLVIKSNQDMDFIHLKDLRASGLEPVDVLSEYKYQDGLGYFQSTRDAATHFFFDQIKKGTYVFEYELKANNAGDFSSGIATIESMYAPEFSGNSKGIRIKITE